MPGHTTQSISPTFNRDSQNLHEQWKSFREQCQFLLIDGPYSIHMEPVHIAVVLNWMGPPSYQIFNNLTFPEDKDKKKLTNVLDILCGHFKPTQSVLQSWYQLGSVYSSQHKDQMEFLNKLKDVAADCSFTNKDKVIKFLFLIHHTNERVKDYLIEHMKPDNTLGNVLQLAKTVETTVQTETLSKQPLQNVGKLNQTEIHGFNMWQRHSPKRSKSKHHNNHSQSHHRSGSHGGKCCNCGSSINQKCPAYERECYKCHKENHFSKLCRSSKSTGGGSKAQSHSCHDVHEMEGKEIQFQYDTDAIEIKGTLIKFTIPVYKSSKELSSNVAFDEISNQPKCLQCALTDFKLCNKAGNSDKVCFKLDTGVSGYLLPLKNYLELFPKNLTKICLVQLIKVFSC